MPTPSSNQPHDPSSPPPYSFPSCPDDLQQPPPPLQHIRGEMRSSDNSEPERRSPTPEDAPSGDSDSQPSLTVGREDSLFVDDRVSAEPSSRATTVSPRPHGAAEGALPEAQNSNVLDNRKVQAAEKSRRAGHGTETKPRPLGCSPADLQDDEIDASDEVSDGDIHSSSYMGLDYTNRRSIPLCPSSYLRPGSKFHGTQQSERQVYDVQVEIKHVDMRESFLCGYLRIQGLTEDHPTLTTYFEGEIIGTKYNFITQHEDWGANAKVDLSHWAKFGAFRPYQKQARKGPVTIPDVTQKENIFMRWKEHFLVPDHRVRTISGASFEGFYYICFNQVRGEVSGIYFHSKSEKFQQLELKHVQDRGCFTAMEFR